MHGTQSMQEASTRSLDLVLLYPGAVEGGSDQIIIDVLPEVVRRSQVSAWAFERTLHPVPVVALLLDTQADALSDIVDTCEEMLSSRVRDDPALVMQALVEVPGRGELAADVPCGVRHSRIEASNDVGKVRGRIVLEQAISTVALTVLGNVRSRQWDRKTLAPSLLAALLDRVGGSGNSATVAYGIMQYLLADDPAGEALTRQFRKNAHKLGEMEVPILLDGAALAELEDEIGALMDTLAEAVNMANGEGETVHVATVWQRLAGGIGFSAVEAAYLACLMSSCDRGQK